MQPEARSFSLRTLAVYLVIGSILAALIVFGIRFAKQRADFYANRSQAPAVVTQPEQQNPPATTPPQPSENNQQNQQPQNTPPSTPPSTPANNPPVVATTPPAQSQTPTNTAGVTRVPSTGPEDFFVSTIGLAVIGFAAVRYVQTRRRLLALP